MITVEVYQGRIEGIPVATLSFTGKGKTCTITTEDGQIKETLSELIKQKLKLPDRGRAYPDDRQLWMESLPKAIDTPFNFVIMENELQEEEINEDTEDDIEEEDGEEADNSSDDGGDEESDSGDEDGFTTNGRVTS